LSAMPVLLDKRKAKILRVPVKWAIIC